jgi:hypothetical protein
MDRKSHACAVCGDPDHARRFVIQEHEVVLCGAHAALVVRAKPKTWEQLRELMRPRCGLTTLADRRSPLPRRDAALADRRFFPRPEGRRSKPGRRVTDEDG